MEAYQKRLIEEHEEMTLKIERSTRVIETDKFHDLSDPERRMLLRQRAAMKIYHDVLGECIIAFEQPTTSLRDLMDSEKEIQ